MVSGMRPIAAFCATKLYGWVALERNLLSLKEQTSMAVITTSSKRLTRRTDYGRSRKDQFALTDIFLGENSEAGGFAEFGL